MKCPACDIETSEDAQFCGGCGASLSASIHLLVSEQRRLNRLRAAFLRQSRQLTTVGLSPGCGLYLLWGGLPDSGRPRLRENVEALTDTIM